MYSHDDLKSVHGFLRVTAEGNLKKMLVGGSFTEMHLRMLVKICRAVTEVEWITHFEAASFPKVKFSPPESAEKEKFWLASAEALCKVGLLTAGKKAAA